MNIERTELVFEKRNKAYGGYVIRRDYANRVLYALLITVLGLGLSVAIPRLTSVMSPDEIVIINKYDGVIEIMQPPPPRTLPSVVSPPQAQQGNTKAFTTPKVVDTAPATGNLVTTEELNKNSVGVKTIEEGNGVLANGPSVSVAEPIDNSPVLFAEVMPSFVGGEAKLFEYLQRNIKYPPVARETGIEGIVYVTFVVDVDGKIINAKILRGIGGGCDEEALRVISGMPQWKAGYQHGSAVKVQFNIPVSFTLKKN